MEQLAQACRPTEVNEELRVRADASRWMSEPRPGSATTRGGGPESSTPPGRLQERVAATSPAQFPTARRRRARANQPMANPASEMVPGSGTAAKE